MLGQRDGGQDLGDLLTTMAGDIAVKMVVVVVVVVSEELVALFMASSARV